ncbi:MAG TPA: tetratricopeptide repeat protein [Polyangiaceae bacterium]
MDVSVGYWTYYLAWFALAYAIRYPWLALGALVFFLLRKVVPDPFVLLRTAGRIGALRRQIEANPANVTARRDLAMILVERLRPRAALPLLVEARERDPNNAELAYLLGLARFRSGDAEGALAPLVEAVELDPRVRFGEPYLCAALALVRLGRLEEAEDAFERYVDSNSSSVEGHVRLAVVRSHRDDKEGAKKALAEALETWRQIPPYQRRKQLRWWFRAQFARLAI